MSVLSDRDLIRTWPGCKPGPASVDLHLGETLRVWPDYVVRDPRTDQSDQWRDVPLFDGVWTIKPGLRYLATTLERVRIPDNLAGQIAARSSWGRDGLAVICGPAGWIDPGFNGRITLELSVVGSPLVIWPGAAACQLVVMELSTLAMQPYSGRYQGDLTATPSRFHQDWEGANAV